MNKFLEYLGIFFIALSVFMIGFLGAYTIDTFYDGVATIREHEDRIYNLTTNNGVLRYELISSKEQVFKLMGETTVLKNNLYFLEENLREQLAISKEEFLQLRENYPLYNDLKKSTVYIVNKVNSINTSAGTGVIIKKEGVTNYILTNKHVCNEKTADNCYVEILKHYDFVQIPLTFVKEDKNYDLSLWKTSQFLPDKQNIKGLADAVPQDKIYSVGSYLGLKYIYTEGTFAGYYENDYVMNMPCTYGCSGSGVYDENGKLIALVRASFQINIFDVDTSKTVCVSAENIKLFLMDIL